MCNKYGMNNIYFETMFWLYAGDCSHVSRRPPLPMGKGLVDEDDHLQSAELVNTKL
jgi:hypothetical protein